MRSCAVIYLTWIGWRAERSITAQCSFNSQLIGIQFLKVVSRKIRPRLMLNRSHYSKEKWSSTFEKCQMRLKIKTSQIRIDYICPLIDCHALVDHFWKIGRVTSNKLRNADNKWEETIQQDKVNLQINKKKSRNADKFEMQFK